MLTRIVDPAPQTQEVDPEDLLRQRLDRDTVAVEFGEVGSIGFEQRLAHESCAADTPVGVAGHGVAEAGVDAPHGERRRKAQRLEDLRGPAQDREQAAGLTVHDGQLIHRPARCGREHLLGALAEQRQPPGSRVDAEARGGSAENSDLDGGRRSNSFSFGHHRRDEEPQPSRVRRPLSQ